jgi:cell division FtsZ-interacting protein ZapD
MASTEQRKEAANEEQCTPQNRLMRSGLRIEINLNNVKFHRHIENKTKRHSGSRFLTFTWIFLLEKVELKTKSSLDLQPHRY